MSQTRCLWVCGLAISLWLAGGSELRGAAAELETLLLPVSAPPARCVAVSDGAAVLALAAQDQRGGFVLLFALDSHGQVSGEPTRVDLPAPATPGNLPLVALDIQAHPTRPRFYLWLDLVVPDGQQPPPEVERYLDHLLVIDWLDGRPQVVYKGARGEAYAVGQPQGAISLDWSDRRLFLPNLLTPVEGQMKPAIGFARLGGDDLAQLGAEQQPLLEMEALDRYAMVGGWPGPIVAGSSDTIVFGAPLGFAAWTRGDRRQTFHAVPLRWGRVRSNFAAHPTLPMVYLVPQGTQYLYAMSHARGYLTMLPQEFPLSAGVAESRPLVLGSRRQLAIATSGGIDLIDVDGDGRLLRLSKTLSAAGSRRAIIAYSPRFDRLYVAGGGS